MTDTALRRRDAAVASGRRPPLSASPAVAKAPAKALAETTAGDTDSDAATAAEKNAAPVVALHGSAASGRRLQPLLDALGRRGRTPDLPGYGAARDARPDAAGGLEALAEALAPAIEAEGRPVHLIGHSFGGAVALSIARLRPDLVASLTLYEPTLFHLLADSTHPRDALLLAGVRTVSARLSAALASGRPEDGMAGFVDFWNGAGVWESADPALKTRLAGEAESVADDFAAADADRWRLEELALDRPLLVLSGLASPQIARRIAAMLAASPGARLELLPGCGHMAPLAEPDVMAPRIAAHLDAVDRRAARASHPQL